MHAFRRLPLRLRPALRLSRSFSSFQERMLLSSVDSLLVDDPLHAQSEIPQPQFDLSKVPKRSNVDLLEGVENVDPFAIVKEETELLSSNIKDLLGSDHPVLSTVSNYFFNQDGGKKVRPVMVLLMSKAAAHHASVSLKEESTINSRQIRLAEITEMIHTASLLHDDVIDVADTRRGVKSVNQLFGNKLAILAGDFLLARSSVCLARLRDLEVTEILSLVIEHLVKGEIMQMKADLKGPEAFEYYLRKNYYKTGSLIANSVLASVMLGSHDGQMKLIAFQYGQAVGQAFQLIDDALDFEGSLETTGKPSLADLKQGFATAPVLFAQDDFPDLRTLIERKFSYPGDIERAATYVDASSSIKQTRDLALRYAESAIVAIKQLHQSPERDALIHLALKIVNRKR